MNHNLLYAVNFTFHYRELVKLLQILSFYPFSSTKSLKTNILCPTWAVRHQMLHLSKVLAVSEIIYVWYVVSDLRKIARKDFIVLVDAQILGEVWKALKTADQ